MALVRAVGPGGRVVSVERRDDHAGVGRKSIERYFGGIPDTLELRNGDVVDAVADVRPERLILDVPEPWHVVAPAAEHLEPGGVFCAYVPTVPQVQQTRDALRQARRFIETRTFEVLEREWSVEGRSVRPTHQMIGHTGFITVARRVMPLADERAPKSEDDLGDRAAEGEPPEGNAGETE
jgi:tRNA (adenine57-N1/adenine58-N1)-methyltransferase